MDKLICFLSVFSDLFETYYYCSYCNFGVWMLILFFYYVCHYSMDVDTLSLSPTNNMATIHLPTVSISIFQYTYISTILYVPKVHMVFSTNSQDVLYHSMVARQKVIYTYVFTLYFYCFDNLKLAVETIETMETMETMETTQQ